MTEQLLKGCKVHWLRSCQRVADRVANSSNSQLENKIFLAIAYKIQELKSQIQVVACFETLCAVRSVAKLLEILPSICTSEEAKYIDDHCDWSHAKHWAQWWTRASQNAVKSILRCHLTHGGSVPVRQMQ